MQKKYYNMIISEKLSYNEALNRLTNKKAKFITRPEWSGVHFLSKEGKYCILLKTGGLIIDPEEKYDINKDDWIVVNITSEGYNILDQANLI